MWPTMVFGVILLFADSLEHLSYDLPFIFRGNRGAPEDVVIVYADESSLVELQEKTSRLLNRTNHTRLLNRLAKDGAKLVFYDFLFSVPDPDPQVDRNLSDAIHANHCVVLVGTFQASGSKVDLIAPIPVLASSAQCWGHANFVADSGFSVRMLPRIINQVTNAAWMAACRLPGFGTTEVPDPKVERWLNFYGRPGEGFRSYRFAEALSTNLADGFFSNKVVFVGSHLIVGGVGEARDEYATPYTRFGGPLAPGVEIQATAVLNLVNHEWLRRLPWWLEIPAVVVWGYVGSLALVSLCQRGGVPRFLAMVLLAMVGATVLICFLQWHYRWWTNWLVPVVLQPVLATQFLGVTGFFLAKAQVKKEPYLAFLSYHNDPDGSMANLIKRELNQSGDRIFYAPDTLEAGHLIEMLQREVERATYFILIVSKESLIKCVKPDDWVRLELVRAVELRKKIILVFQRGFSFDSVLDPAKEPKAAEIDRLAPWRFIKGVEVDPNRPESDVEELRRLMESEGALAKLQRLFTRRAKVGRVEEREAAMTGTQAPRP